MLFKVIPNWKHIYLLICICRKYFVFIELHLSIEQKEMGIFKLLKSFVWW